MIQAGDLVMIKDGGWNGCLALVMFKHYDTVERLKILEPIALNGYGIKGYLAYNIYSLEKL